MLFSPPDCALGNQVTNVSSVSGLFFISTVIDAGPTCGQSFRNMIGNAGFAPEQHFARLSLGLHFGTLSVFI